jgi:hypothetical protein
VLSESQQAVPNNDLGSRIPGGLQWGAKWNHKAQDYETSILFFDGRNHQPLFETGTESSRIDFLRLFPRIRMYGVDGVRPFGSFTLRGEVAYFSSPEGDADEYVLYVLQAEHNAGDWSFTAGYAGEAVFEDRAQLQFSSDHGFARASQSCGLRDRCRP